YQELAAKLDAGRSPVEVSGLSGVHRAHLAAALGEQMECPVILIVPDENEGKKLSSDIKSLTGKDSLLLAGREFTFHDATISHQWEHKRLKTLQAMLEGDFSFLIATVEGLMQRSMPPETLKKASVKMEVGQVFDLKELTAQLISVGYGRCDQVEGPGQFSLRGGILDVYSPGMSGPVRAEFWGDEVDTMGLFDPSSQRRTENIQRALLLPAAETLPHLAKGGTLGLVEELEQIQRKLQKSRSKNKGLDDLLVTLRQDSEKLAQLASFPAADRYLDLIYPEFSCAADYLPEFAFVLWADSSRCRAAGENYLWRISEDAQTLCQSGILRDMSIQFAPEWEGFVRYLVKNYPNVYLDNFLTGSCPSDPVATLAISCKQLPSFGASLETAVSDLLHYQREGTATVVLCASQGRVKALWNLLQEQEVPAAIDLDLKQLPGKGQTYLTVGGLSAGMEYPGFAVLTEGSALPERRETGKTKAKKDTNRQKLQSFTDLSPGDLVVHETHGIGRFVELVKMKVDGVEKDYIKLAYSGSDTLYVPATQLDLVSKYIGGGEDANERTKLSKLGGTDWTKAKLKARKATKELAKGLIQLYAERQRQPGYAFHPDDPWQQEFEDKFEYQETEDQLRCIREIKEDMEKPVPMDRLLCGDVGYGKTEVALRAVMKCVMEGKQAAILAPTTVLANQHFKTAVQRFQGFPVKIAVVSRFQTPHQMKLILKDLEKGLIDVLVGTHRLFSKDIQFKDLGLLVVDEEQRFGVSQKERLKEITRQVDVLTLSATPIPRTMNMALSGIRDMSTLEEPPMDRQPVQTYVMEHNWSMLADAMGREIGRGGQVYYLHNRVESIQSVAMRIQGMLGEDVKVAYAHGKMTEDQLHAVMSKVIEGEVQVLVCTTIIETGIDIPNVNTLIIEDADKMGLAQLHQIRGRVGRSSRRAFAYLTYKRGKVLSEVAAKRLAAVREFAEFGAGFKIAMRDLEIRGAGNLLGPEQSGFMMTVGYDMYLKLLEEAVLEERGEKPVRTEEVTADLSISANIPEYYIPSAEQRMDLYRRIARIRNEED
ncbi:MAG: transcription-repair coupling factor, partial [Oscillospiraceae bacterium]|nr:transcription-repair coupling factor [Oscillospiraceae bacterium]